MDLKERMSTLEKDVRISKENIEACKVAIHYLNNEIKELVEVVDANADTLEVIVDTQKKIIKVAKKHKTTINNIAKITGINEDIKKIKKKDYIS